MYSCTACSTRWRRRPPAGLRVRSHTGPAVITQADQARVLGEVADRPVQVKELSREDANVGVSACGDDAFTEGALVDNPEPVVDTVEQLTGRPARTFEQWAHDHAGDLRLLTTAEAAL